MTEVTEAPDFSSALAVRLAAELYGLNASAGPLPSERDQNFLLTASDGRRFVLKIANASEEFAALDLQNRAMDHLAGEEEPLPCPRLVRSLSGQEIETAVGPDAREHFVRLVGLKATASMVISVPASVAMWRVGTIIRWPEGVWYQPLA